MDVPRIQKKRQNIRLKHLVTAVPIKFKKYIKAPGILFILCDFFLTIAIKFKDAGKLNEIGRDA